MLVSNPQCDVTIRDSDGDTALHDAAKRGHSDVVRVLVSNPQCDVTIRNNVGHTAADVARNEGHQDIVALLEAKPKGKLYTRYLLQ